MPISPRWRLDRRGGACYYVLPMDIQKPSIRDLTIYGMQKSARVLTYSVQPICYPAMPKGVSDGSGASASGLEMRVHLKTLNGKTIMIPTNAKETIGDFKTKTQVKEKISLNFAGKELKDDKMMNHYKIKNGSIIHLQSACAAECSTCRPT